MEVIPVVGDVEIAVGIRDDVVLDVGLGVRAG